MPKEVFLSCFYTDLKYKNKIMKWASTGKLGEGVKITSAEDDDVHDKYGDIVYEKLVKKVRDAEMVIVLVGEQNMEHPWLDFEGEFCHQWGIKRWLMRIPYTEGKLPEPFTYLNELAYNPNSIEKELRTEPESTFNY